MSAAIHNLNAKFDASSSTETTPTLADRLDSMPWLPCTLSVEVPVERFTVADLLGMEKGTIVETSCHQTSDLPLRVNQLLIGWTEFEVVGDRLAVRITEQI